MKFFRFEELKPWMPPFFFLAKVAAGFALWWVYSFHYADKKNSDIWKYFNDSQVMYDALHDHPSDYFHMVSGIGAGTTYYDEHYYHRMNFWNQQFDNNLANDAHILIRFNAILRLFSLGNYHIHSLFMCMLAFIGLCALFRVILPFIRGWKYFSAAIIFLLPSLLFWTSGVLKEGLMIFTLGIIIYQSFLWFTDNKLHRLLYIVICSWILFITKFYVLAALLPSLTGLGWTLRSGKNIFSKYLLTVTLFLIAGLTVKFIKPTYDPLKILAWKQNDFLRLARGGTYLLSDSVVAFIASDHHEDLQKVNDSTFHIREGANYYYWYFYPDFSDTVFVKKSHDYADYRMLTDFPRAGSLMGMNELQPNVRSFIRATPLAMLHALLRPYPWEGKNVMMLFPILENIFLVLLLFMMFKWKAKPISPPFTGFCFTFSLLLLLVMGITTPVLGALVRYRIAALPLLMIGLLSLIDAERINSYFKKKK
ncbi:MAG: hypothetical protein HY064_08790 [Bacteroidetes bacterium]|nr:hypothetical protein [Bacteroidota bacterium]